MVGHLLFNMRGLFFQTEFFPGERAFCNDEILKAMNTICLVEISSSDSKEATILKSLAQPACFATLFSKQA